VGEVSFLHIKKYQNILVKIKQFLKKEEWRVLIKKKT